MIQKIYSDSKDCNPIKFLVWEDFIEPEIYLRMQEEIFQNWYQIMDVHSNEHRNNKSVALKGETLEKVFHFFQSKAFEKYLSIYLQMPIRQEFYVASEQISEVLWNDFKGAIAQVYEKWDFFDWHIDGPLEQGSLWAFTYYLWWYDGDWGNENGWNLEFGMKKISGAWNIEGYYTIPYKRNTLVFIYAWEFAYHRVTPVVKNRNRLSIQSTIFKD